MADTVAVQKLIDTTTRAVFKLTNISDSTGELKVLKVDVSSLSGYQTGATVRINRVMFSVGPVGSVVLYFDGATDAEALVLTQTGDFDLKGSLAAPILDNSVTPVGDILLSTRGFTNASGYTIILECQKVGFEGGSEL